MNRGFATLLAVALLAVAGPAAAGPREDAAAAYSRGDYATAFGLWRQEAEQGDGSAQALLGFMYHDGEGVPRNYVLAAMWFHLAASNLPADGQDSKDAWDAKAITETLMTPAEITQANDKAYQCQAQSYKNCD